MTTPKTELAPNGFLGLEPEPISKEEDISSPNWIIIPLKSRDFLRVIAISDIKE